MSLTAPDVLASAPLDTDALAALTSRIRRHLHQRPEVGFAVHGTAAFLQELLRAHGLEPGPTVAEAGFTLEIAGAHPGPTIGYRTELDALPEPDAKDVPYASRVPGAAHLCGHDAHMAVAVAVALLLYARRDRLHGTVRLLFQPNEEGLPSGAPRMIADGALDGLRELFCIHVDPSLEVGRIALRAGPVTAATAAWEVHLETGQAGHSARPHETVDTVWVATQILSAFYQLPGRVHDARRAAVLTACRIRGGEALNVIPSSLSFGGTLRCVDPDALRFLLGRMEAVTRQTAALHGTDIRFETGLGLPPVMNDPGLVEAVATTAREVLGPRAVHLLPEPSMGGEDFAFYTERIPGALVRVGTRGGPETGFPLHHARFDVDERALPLAARLMAEVLARRLAPETA